MKARRLLSNAVAVAAAFALLPPHCQAKGDSSGTDITHFNADVAMQPVGSDLDAMGSVALSQQEQGKAAYQDLEITVGNLDPDSTYDLLAVVGGQTNLVTQFTTDETGSAHLSYIQQSGSAEVVEAVPLPPELDPVGAVEALLIGRTVQIILFIPPDIVLVFESTETFLAADLLSPDSMQYLFKRSLVNEGVDPDAAGSLEVKSDGLTDHFRLRATGLDPNASYHLAIDGELVQTLISDSQGTIKVRSLPAEAAELSTISRVAILNATGSSVLSASVP